MTGTTKIGSFLKRSKIPVDIEDNTDYKRVTIRINHNGISVRDVETGKQIGTKKQFILKSGQFVLSKIDARYGAFGIAPSSVDGAIITGNFWAYDVDFTQVNIEWFNQFTNSPQFYELCERASTGITHRKYLSETFFLNYEIALPSVSKQLILIEKIKKFKIEHFNLSSELTQQLNLVKNLRQQFLQDAVQGKLVEQNFNDEPASVLLEKIKAEKARLIKDKVFKKEKELSSVKPYEIPFDIPENWVWSRLGEVGYITSGSTPSQDAFVTTGIPYLKMYNLKNQKVDFHFKPQYIKAEVHNGQLKRCRAYPGDILMNIVGPPLGKIAIIPDDLSECNFNQAAVLIRPIYKAMNLYIFWYLNEMSEINAIDTKGIAGQANISVTQAHNMKVPLPPLAEQFRIVQRLEELMQTCDALEASIKQSQLQNEQLLQQVLREALTKEAKPQSPSIKEDIPATKTSEQYAALLLAAEIIWQLNQKKTLGHIKLQKLIYLCNRTQQMNLPVSFLKQAMGPYDPQLQRYLDQELKAREWFQYNEEEPLKYKMLKNAGGHKADYKKYFAGKTEEIDHLVQLFENSRSAQIEIVATLFWCWDEMLTNNQLVNDAALLADFYKWSEFKGKYAVEKVIDALRWMEGQGITPKTN